MERKAIRVNVEVVYDDGTVYEAALDEPQVKYLPRVRGWPVGITVAGMLKHSGDGESWE